MTEQGRRVTIRRLTTKSPTMMLSVAVAVVGSAAIVGWGLVTQTGTNRVMAALVGTLVIVFVAMLAWRRTWVDTGAGTISRRSIGSGTRTLSWAEASVVDLQPNRAGQLNLRVRGAAGTILAAVVAVDLGGDRSMQPDQLRLLAEEIDRWAPERARLAEALRAQADHVESGGSIRESPLAARL